MKLAAALVFLSAISAHPETAPAGIWAAASVNKPIFVLGREEVDLTFAARNDSNDPVPYEDIRGRCVLVINGKELKDSGFLFGNGPRETAKFVKPGKTTLFSARLTSYFAKPGKYEVIWRGKGFAAKPIFFRVVESY